VRIVTFVANYISESYSAIQTVYLDQPTNQQITPAQIKHSALSGWHLPLALEDSWTYLLTCCVQQFTADRWPLTADHCDAVMLKANQTANVQDLCRCR